MRPERCDLLCLSLPRAEEIRAASPQHHVCEGAAERARALGDPTRLLLAAALAQSEELCVCDLAWISGRSQNLVSHHLKALRLGRLVGARREGKLVMYSLTELGHALVGALLPQATRTNA